jgi:Flp pilus assembly protein TadD
MMKQVSLAMSLILIGLMSTVVSCDSSKPVVPAVKTGAAEAVPAPETALMAAAGSPGRADNDEGVAQYKQGKMDAAIEWFQKAVKADPKSAEANYNLGLSFDKTGKHAEATAAFKQAAALSPTNPAIKDSAIVKKHLS